MSFFQFTNDMIWDMH